MKNCSNCKRESKEYELTNGVCFHCYPNLLKVPKMYHSCDFKGFVVDTDNKQAVKTAKAFVNSKKGIFITGQVGTGKTHLGVAILHEVIKNGKNIQFVTMANLFMRLRDGFKLGTTELGVIEQYFNRVVLFDDFGAEKQSEYTIQAVYTLLANRYNKAEHKIIITSNLSLDEIAEKMDDRIASRIAGMCEVVELKGKDYRIRQAEQETSDKKSGVKRIGEV